jgi:PKD repeat protein
MKQKTIVLITAFLAVLLLAGCVSAAQQVTISDVTLDKDGTGTATIYLDSAPQGLSVFKIGLVIDDPTVADDITLVAYPFPPFTNADTNGNTANPCTVAFNDGYVKAGAASATFIPDGSTNILLATITLHGLSAGTTTITPTLLRVDDNYGGDYLQTTTINTPTITVGTISSVTAAAATTTTETATTATTSATTTMATPTAATETPTPASTTTMVPVAALTVPPVVMATSSLNGGPACGFTSSVVAGSTPFRVSFQDRSSGSPTSWEWDFGDGGTSMAQNPSYTYQSPGTYTVSLTVTNDIASTTSTRTDYITVLKPGEVLAETVITKEIVQTTMTSQPVTATKTPIRRPSATPTKSAAGTLTVIAAAGLGIAGYAVLRKKQDR